MRAGLRILRAVHMSPDQALKIAEKLWPKRLLACGEYAGGVCRVEQTRTGGPWITLAEAPSWEELFRNVRRKVTVQQSLL